MKNALLTFFILACISIAPCYADGLDALVEIGKSQTEMQKILDLETNTFERVKSAVERGEISKGRTKTAIKDKYGEPVVITQDAADRREKWVYKPATSSFFKGVKICLFFDANGLLDEIRTVEDGKKD